MLRREGRVLRRLLHPEGSPCEVRAWVSGGAVRMRSTAESREAARGGLERMHFALGLDQDLADFHRAFRRDPLLGPVIRRRPWLRPRRRPEPFEALAWAICEQLIEGSRAVEIEKQLVRRHGRRSACGRAARRAHGRRAGLALAGRARALRAVAQARDRHAQGGDRGGHAAGPTCSSPSPPGGACAASTGSAPGRWRSSPWRARAATTSSPPATSPTSSWSASWPAWAAGRPSPRCASSSPRTRPTRAWRAPTR